MEGRPAAIFTKYQAVIKADWVAVVRIGQRAARRGATARGLPQLQDPRRAGNDRFYIALGRPYPIAFCTQGFRPGTRARRTPAFTSHGLLLRKRIRR